MPARGSRRLIRLSVLLLLSLFWSTYTLAGLTASSAGELYSRWQQLSADEQLPALTELAEFYSRHDTTRAIELSKIALGRVDAKAPAELTARLHNSHAYALHISGNAAEALPEAISTEKFATEHALYRERGKALMVQGYIYRQAGLTEQALVVQQRALQDFEQTDDIENRGRALRNLASLLSGLRQFEQAEKYLNQIEALIPIAPDVAQLKAAVAEVRGYGASLRADNAKALASYQDALKWATEADDFIGQHVYHAAIGHELLELNRPAEALLMADRGLMLMQASGSDSRDINLLRIKANALAALGRQDEAHALFLQLVAKAEQRNDRTNLAVLWNDLFRLEKTRARFAEAMDYLERARTADIAVTDDNNARRTALLEAVFDSERKTRQIAQLQNETRIQQLELDRQRQRLIVTITLALLLSAVSFIYFQRRQHKQELARQQALNAKLQELDGVKDRMLANTSHELRTPLNGIVGLSELLMAEEPSPQAREYLQLIADSGRRLAAVVSELLETARLREGTLRLEPQAVDLHEPLRKALLICQPMALQKKLQLLNQLPEQLPPVWADPARVEQMLINLITNAIRFTEQGRVTVSAMVAENDVTLSVQDTGIGIPLKLQDRIFEPFVQGDASMARKHQGVGLGLAICKDLVLLHGGRIGVESREGQGSRFWFTLPRAQLQSA